MSTAESNIILNDCELGLQVSLAAQRATVIMRAIGLTLTDHVSRDVPLLEEMEQHLHQIVDVAIDNYRHCRMKAPSSTSSDEVQGFYSDQQFKIVVRGAMESADIIDLEIAFRLV